MDLNKLLSDANQSAREATAVLQANITFLEKLPTPVLERISAMCFKAKMAWNEIEDRIQSIISYRE